MKQFLLASMVAAILVGCASHNVENGGREPTQSRWGNNNGPIPYPGPNGNLPGDRRDDRRDNRWGNNNNRPGNGYGSQSWRMRGNDNRRCIGCFDRYSFNDAFPLGMEMSLTADQTSFRGGTSLWDKSEAPVFRDNCGIRSISVEVLDNEAQITGLEVHYSGTSSFNWDVIPVRKDWDFRNGSQEGERSVWFDVGSNRWDDRVCIDRVKVIGYTYKDTYWDFASAKVQVYGSRTRRGVSDNGPGWNNGPGPGPGWNNGPGPGPVVIVTPPPRPSRSVRGIKVGINRSCLNNIPPEGKRDGKSIGKWAENCDKNNPERRKLDGKFDCKTSNVVVDHAGIQTVMTWKTSLLHKDQEKDLQNAYSELTYDCQEYY